MKTTFFCKNLTRIQLKIGIAEFAKIQRAKKVIFSKRAIHVNGSYSPTTKVIYLCDKLAKKPILYTFFHELSHHIACEQDEWIDYHFDRDIFSSDKIFLFENKIDKIAKQLWNENVSQKIWGKYKYSYPQKNKRFLLRWIKKHMKTKNAQRIK